MAVLCNFKHVFSLDRLIVGWLVVFNLTILPSRHMASC